MNFLGEFESTKQTQKQLSLLFYCLFQTQELRSSYSPATCLPPQVQRIPIPAVSVTAGVTSFQWHEDTRICGYLIAVSPKLAVSPSLGTMSPVKQTVFRQRQKGLNPTVRKHRRMNFFQILNHSKILWDPRSKPKGLLGGHLNSGSIVSKSNQLQHLLTLIWIFSVFRKHG